MLKEGNHERTPLTSRHERLGARMAPFGGFLMPIQYTGIVAEHESARHGTAVFDTCHMGEFRVSGPTALADIEHLVSCDVAPMDVGQCRYGMMCNPSGGVIDDLLVYRLDEDDFMLVVNAGTQGGDFEWVSSHASGGTILRDISDETAKVDLQGPGAPRTVQRLLDAPIDGMKFYRFQHNSYKGQQVLISRTGYTGEIGFEFYGSPDLAVRFWDDCLEAGAVPAGLGARDPLRLEVGMPLYGHELSADRNAARAGFSRSISGTKSFVGAEALRSEDGRKECLVGLAFEGRQTAREGNRILSGDGSTIGIVTSGSYAPSLGHAIALGYVTTEVAVPGTEVVVEARRSLPGVVVELPFYREGTARKALAGFLA